MKHLIATACCYLFLTVIPLFAQENKLQTGLALKYVVREPAKKSGKPPVVILLHGYGSNENDLMGLARFFPDNYLIISARAPYPAPTGGYQWFEREKKERKYTVVKEQLESSRKQVLKFIPEVTGKYNADAANVYVMGFSQGAIMSYAAGLTSPASMKGIGVLSGILPPALMERVKPSTALSNLRIFIAHGTSDMVLLYEDGKAANDFLTGIGLKPQFNSFPGMGHTISNEVMNDLMKWLKQP